MKNESIRKVINVDRPNYSPVWNFKQEDDGVIKLALFKDSTALNITGQTIKLCAKRPNNSIVELEEQSNFEINNNELDITLKNNILAVPGVVECDLEIVDAVGKMTTASFYLTVSKKMTGNENIEASNDISAINKIVAEVEAKALKLDTDIKNLVIEANKKIMQIESAANIQLEEIQADYEAIKQVVNKDENIRKSNEAIRVNNESNRVSAESLRAAAETKRTESESNRISAEETRALEFNKIKEENYIFKQDVYKQILNSKTDYFGKEHLSVDERLNEDFDNVHQRINDSSLLEYEGCNISADNSYYGLTKDMVVKGRTLQNLHKPYLYSFAISGAESGTDFTTVEKVNEITINRLTDTVPRYTYVNCGRIDASKLKPNTKYTVVFEEVENIHRVAFHGGDTGNILAHLKPINNNKAVLTTIPDFSTIDTNPVILYVYIDSYTTNTRFRLKNAMIIEGDHTNTPVKELPYGEGIYSVGDLISEGENQGKYRVQLKSCGKNLFNKEYVKIFRGYFFHQSSNGVVLENNATTSILIKNVSNKKLIISKKETPRFIAAFTNSDIIYAGLPLNNLILNGDTATELVIENSGNFKNIMLYVDNTSATDEELQSIIDSIQLEEVQNNVLQSTPYEPYQEDIKTYYLDEPLMSLPNGVKDEVVGNKLIRRVGKTIFVGSKDEKWGGTGNEDLELTSFFTININDKKTSGAEAHLCDRFIYNGNAMSSMGDKECYGSYTSNPKSINIRILRSKLATDDVIGFKAWLRENPVTIYYELEEPIIAELDESLVLNTYDGTTHITSDNYLLPTISCKIPSNVQAVISNLYTNNNILTNEVSNLSLENKDLKDTNDIQDILIDTTMMATDEMFVMLEPLLPNIPTTMNLKEVSKMVDLYVAMVMRGLKTIEEVPSRYREEVARILSELEK